MKTFTKKNTECKNCNSKRSLKRYSDNKDEITNQRKIIEKNGEKLLQKQTDRYINFREVLRPYVELQNRLTEMEEKVTTNDSENN